MSDLNTAHNRIVWLDIPVHDLDRAITFYQNVLGLPVHKQAFENFQFAVFDHGQGNGACLVPQTEPVPSEHFGLLVYLNVHGRMQEAMVAVEKHGGKVSQPPIAIGPHGFRAIVWDSEGNRIALHSGVGH